MVRIRMPLRLIDGERHRNATFTKRKAVIKKKTMELGVLCDVSTLLVCYGPRGQLETWPEDPREVRRRIDHFRGLGLDESAKRRYGVAAFLGDHLKKQRAQLARDRAARLGGPAATEESLEELARSLDAKLAAIDERISCLMLEESFKENDGCRGGADTAAADAAWAAPRLEAPYDVLPLSILDPFLLPPPISDDGLGLLAPIPDHGGLNALVTGCLDDFIDFSPFAAAPMNSGANIAAATSGFSSSAATSVFNPAQPAAFPLSSCRDHPLGGCSGGGGTMITSFHAPPFYQSAGPAAEYGYSVGQPSGICDNLQHHSHPYRADIFHVQQAPSYSPEEAWFSSVFPDLAPPGCSSSIVAPAAAPAGDEAPELQLPESIRNPYA